MCPYCQQDTAGNHETGCPNRQPPIIRYNYPSKHPGITISLEVGKTLQQALQQIRELAKTYIICESGRCSDCDLLRRIQEIAEIALNDTENTKHITAPTI